ncbi:hypothetical protein CES85_4971 [Ochrobactrum quorumnocens]|uniref:Uncharacterized protein n=1 Tax=Ochrobactrum quorumnocens TaxID=271865 RepID=A0A248UCX2_9HYPH|nr:hypothetical protein CES85_4971 [[Ochrobactrum] quorumnocens]
MAVLLRDSWHIPWIKIVRIDAQGVTTFRKLQLMVCKTTINIIENVVRYARPQL